VVFLGRAHGPSHSLSLDCGIGRHVNPTVGVLAGEWQAPASTVRGFPWHGVPVRQEENRGCPSRPNFRNNPSHGVRCPPLVAIYRVCGIHDLPVFNWNIKNARQPVYVPGHPSSKKCFGHVSVC